MSTSTPAQASTETTGQAAEKKRPTVSPSQVIKRIGDTNDQALAYVLSPDPQLHRLSRKAKEALLADLPPVTAGALLGPAALARHFVASGASGRYRDLFALWELFRQRPEDCKPVLAERQQALEKGRAALSKAVRLGLRGHAERVAEDIASAHGLIWTWLREVLHDDLAAVGQRPAIAAALLAREPDLDVPLPAEPDRRWLVEAAAVRQAQPLPPALESLLAAHVGELPATVATLSLAHAHYPERVPALLDRVDLADPAFGAILAWARDHEGVERLRARIEASLEEAAAGSRSDGLAAWWSWRERGVELDIPVALRQPTLDGLDLTRPESAVLLAALRADGAELDAQAALDGFAAGNRQLGEKAYEAFVCAGLDVRLPPALEANPIVKEGTRCAWCGAWTWVRPGHERRCPRRPADPAPPAASEPVASEPSAAQPAGTAAEAPESPEPPEPPEPREQAEPADVADAWTQALEQEQQTSATDS